MQRFLAFLFLALSACKKDPPKEDNIVVPPMPAVSTGSVDALEKGASKNFGTQFGCASDQIKLQRREAMDHDDHHVFELTGCNHTQILDCRAHHANGAVYPEWADCTEKKP